MLPGMTQQSGTASERELRRLFRDLNEQDQATLLSFAEFLAGRSQPESAMPTVFPEPEVIPRPEQESVVKAIKRLTATYPMIEKDKLLHETSGLMGAHLMQGRAAPDVINDLQTLFAEHYERLKVEFEQKALAQREGGEGENPADANYDPTR